MQNAHCKFCNTNCAMKIMKWKFGNANCEMQIMSNCTIRLLNANFETFKYKKKLQGKFHDENNAMQILSASFIKQFEKL